MESIIYLRLHCELRANTTESPAFHGWKITEGPGIFYEKSPITAQSPNTSHISVLGESSHAFDALRVETTECLTHSVTKSPASCIKRELVTRVVNQTLSKKIKISVSDSRVPCSEVSITRGFHVAFHSHETALMSRLLLL